MVVMIAIALGALPACVADARACRFIRQVKVDLLHTLFHRGKEDGFYVFDETAGMARGALD